MLEKEIRVEIEEVLKSLLMSGWHRKLLSYLLFFINLREYVEERPLLSAIVLHEGGSEPGVGFFKLAEFLDLDCSDRVKFHSEEMKRVMAYWQ